MNPSVLEEVHGHETSPLHLAAKMGATHLVERMWDNVEEIDALDGDRATLLGLAAKWHHRERVELLLSQGANVANISEGVITAWSLFDADIPTLLSRYSS